MEEVDMLALDRPKGAQKMTYLEVDYQEWGNPAENLVHSSGPVQASNVSKRIQDSFTEWSQTFELGHAGDVLLLA